VIGLLDQRICAVAVYRIIPVNELLPRSALREIAACATEIIAYSACAVDWFLFRQIAAAVAVVWLALSFDALIIHSIADSAACIAVSGMH
jgi:hypothetical protein